MAATETVAAGSGNAALITTMSTNPRPQIGIDRLPVRRLSNNEPREAMNCKSCRKRKVRVAQAERLIYDENIIEL